MLKALRTAGLLAWTSCILTLVYQSINWALTASWPSLSVLSVIYEVFGWNMTTPIQALSFEYMIKVLYVLTTTELALALWWLGVICFGCAMLWRIFFK